MFGAVLDKTMNKLSKWKATSLSQACRAMLIHSNLPTKANFEMQIFFYLPCILQGLAKTNRNLFWNKDWNARTANLIG